MSRFDIILREEGFIKKVSYSYNTVKDTLKGMLGLNEDKYCIRDNERTDGIYYTFKDFIDTFVIEEEIAEGSYEEKVNWMKVNGWSFDIEDLSDDEDVAVYRKNDCYWKESDIEEDSLENIKLYKAWYDGLISTQKMKELLPNRPFRDDEKNIKNF